MVAHFSLRLYLITVGQIPPTPLFKGGTEPDPRSGLVGSQVTARFLRALRERQGRRGGTAPMYAATRVAFIRFFRPVDVWLLTFSLRLYLITVGQIPPTPLFKGGTEPDPRSGLVGSQVTARFLRALRERQGRHGGTAPTYAAKRVAFIRFDRPADVWLLRMSGSGG